MADPVDLHTLIRRWECDDPTDTAQAVLAALGMPSRWATVFFPLLRDECRRLARYATRIVEQTATATSELADTSTGTSRRGLLDLHFYNGTEYVTWGAATIADHAGRIAYQSLFRAGLDADIAKHQKAITAIEAAGVSCLAEVDGWATAA